MLSRLKKICSCDCKKLSKFFHDLTSIPTIFHAAVIIFLEFFAFGLLTAPMISVLDEAFPRHALLMNGFVQGIKGFLSFLSAPLIGSLSDLFGRKPFLLLTVTFTCCPLPLIKISHLWYFTFLSLSGMFSVTFSVVLAFVSDITTVENRSWAYGLVSAMFAASLIISPALGALLQKVYSVNFVVMLSTCVALLDILFIIFCVPESLNIAKKQDSSCNSSLTSATDAPTKATFGITWDQADPFGALRRMGNDRVTLIICLTTFLSYLPEAGEYSSFFVYLSLVMGFSEEAVALFIAMCGIVSCLAQTVGLSLLVSCLDAKKAIIVGLAFETIQLVIFGLFTSPWLLWSAGSIAGLGSITYPALSAFLSSHSNSDQQGFAQGLLTGIRGLCLGLGPALYGFIFYIFQVDLTNSKANKSRFSTTLPLKDMNLNDDLSVMGHLKTFHEVLLPGPPFAFGSILSLLAILVAIFIPKDNSKTQISGSSTLTGIRKGGGVLRSDDGKVYKRLSSRDDAFDETETFIGFADGHRRKRDQKKSKSKRIQRSQSESEETKPPHNLHSRTPRVMPFQLKSKSKFTNPLFKFFVSSARVRPSTSELEPLTNPPAILWEAEAADLANYRHAQMTDLLQSTTEYDVVSSDAADVHLGQRTNAHYSPSTRPVSGLPHSGDASSFNRKRFPPSQSLVFVKSPIDQEGVYIGRPSHRGTS